MGVIIIGLSHRTAPLAARERLAFGAADVQAALRAFAPRFPGAEAAILSTCNRVELIVADQADQITADEAIQFLVAERGVPVNSIDAHLFRLCGDDAVAHLIRVTSGLDSMVVGEYHITSQVKRAYTAACEAGTAQTVLNRLFHHAFTVAKRIRNQTDIGSGKVSLQSVAMDAVGEVFPDLSAVKALVIGAGEMSRLSCKYLVAAGVRNLTITTRTLANAAALAASCQGRAVAFDQLDAQIARADLIFTATSRHDAFLSAERIGRARPGGDRPLAIIDLAVPRDVEPAAGRLPGVSLLDVDALGRILDQHQAQRLSHIEQCEAIVAEEVEAFSDWMGMAAVRPLIEMMYLAANRLKEVEVQRVLRRCPDLSEDQKRCIDDLAQRLISKFMHPCVSTLRQPRSNPAATLAQSFQKVSSKYDRD